MNYELIYPRDGDEFLCVSIEDIEVVFDSSFNRKSARNVDSLIEKEKLKIVQNQSEDLYNSPKFRLHSVRKRGKKLVVNLGLTDYFEYLSTNHNKILNHELVNLGIENFDNPDSYLSNALGNVAVAKTSNDKIVLLKRSNNVQTFKGYYDLPGGHPEPSKLSGKNITIKDVVGELFNSIEHELVDELNIKHSDIIKVFNIGFLRSFEDGRTPEMLFYLSLNISSSEIIPLFDEIRDSGEATDILFYSSNNLDTTNAKMTSATKGAIELFKEMRAFLL